MLNNNGAIFEFGAGVLGMPASGRHSHKGHRGKRQIYRSIPIASFSPFFALRVTGLNIVLHSRATHWVFLPAFCVDAWRRNLAIQHNFQVPDW